MTTMQAANFRDFSSKVTGVLDGITAKVVPESNPGEIITWVKLRADTKCDFVAKHVSGPSTGKMVFFGPRIPQWDLRPFHEGMFAVVCIHTINATADTARMGVASLSLGDPDVIEAGGGEDYYIKRFSELTYFAYTAADLKSAKQAHILGLEAFLWQEAANEREEMRQKAQKRKAATHLSEELELGPILPDTHCRVIRVIRRLDGRPLKAKDWSMLIISGLRFAKSELVALEDDKYEFPVR